MQTLVDTCRQMQWRQSIHLSVCVWSTANAGVNLDFLFLSSFCTFCTLAYHMVENNHSPLCPIHFRDQGFCFWVFQMVFLFLLIAGFCLFCGLFVNLASSRAPQPGAQPVSPRLPRGPDGDGAPDVNSPPSLPPWPTSLLPLHRESKCPKIHFGWWRRHGLTIFKNKKLQTSHLTH